MEKPIRSIYVKKPTCLNCGEALSYNEKYDSYFCKLCNQWTEKTCKEPRCCYCPNRPEKPTEKK